MKRYAVIGLGRFGRRLATLLASAGVEVIAVDRRQDLIDDIRDSVTLAVCMDSTEEAALRAQGIDRVDVAVVGMGGDFEDSVLTTVVLKQIGVPKVISRATNTMQGEILTRVGADGLVSPETESAHRWCHRLLGPQVMEQIPLTAGHSLVQMPVPPPWVGKSLAELDIRRKHQVNVVAISRAAPGQEHQGDKPAELDDVEVPLPHTKLAEGDVVFVIGADEQISQLPG